jgi:hypothetical protein
MTGRLGLMMSGLGEEGHFPFKIAKNNYQIDLPIQVWFIEHNIKNRAQGTGNEMASGHF